MKCKRKCMNSKFILFKSFASNDYLSCTVTQHYDHNANILLIQHLSIILKALEIVKEDRYKPYGIAFRIAS